MKITITGSLGNIGKPLTEELVHNGHQVTVITSSEEKKGDIELIGATAAVGKLDDINFLIKTFTGADSVFCMIPPNFAQPDQLLYYQSFGNNYAEAIRESHVKRVVHLSSYGAHLPSGTGFIAGSYRTEQIFNAISTIAWTHVRPTFFYYNLLAFADMIKTTGFIGAVYGGDDKLAMVSPQDIANAVAEELQSESDVTAIRYVNSDERTCNETAGILGKAIGIPTLKWLALPKDKVLQTLLERGLPENAAINLVELGEALHDGRLLEDYELHKPPFGKLKLEEYANEFAREFQKKIR